MSSSMCQGYYYDGRLRAGAYVFEVMAVLFQCKSAMREYFIDCLLINCIMFDKYGEIY